ncbi:MAG TPA: hypothetical protein VF403_10615, partial [Kofleriaceae bacterium]
HSNWFWIPNNSGTFGAFPEGTFSCAAGDGMGHPFDQQVATLFGGVLFAQSTQATQDTQTFPTGAAIRIAPNARIIADIHLLNASDQTLSVPLSLTLDPIPEKEVTTLMAGFAMENLGIALPPNATSKFTVECDLSTNKGQLPTDFSFFHALAHYHKQGIGLTWEAVRDDGSGTDMIWTTENQIGDELGSILDPPFTMTGHSKLRLSCSYDNPTNSTITWGNGNGEMCIAFGYTNSPYVWTAGLISTSDDPGAGVVGTDSVVNFTAPTCTGVIGVPAQ